jgi:hypothetical protein
MPAVASTKRAPTSSRSPCDFPDEPGRLPLAARDTSGGGCGINIDLEVPMSAATPALAQPRPRAGLALLLAVLGVPGVTIAWDLPKGGYWIGLPLAVAAVVLGLRALSGAGRRARGLAIGAIVLGAVEILFTATWILFS